MSYIRQVIFPNKFKDLESVFLNMKIGFSYREKILHCNIREIHIVKVYLAIVKMIHLQACRPSNRKRSH
jgi:hypothetical protein